MNVKKTSRGGAISKTSSTAPASSSATTNGNQKSSILKSAFSPSRLQLSLFASVIQGFESQHLRIHDTNTSRLRCEHAAGAGTKITSLDWGYYGTTYRDQHSQSSKKKRKRDSTNTASAVVAFGTSQSEICMFSPLEAKVVGKLSGPHEQGVKDFKFCGNDHLGAWSIGGEGKLVQWDLRTEKAIRFIMLPDPAVNILAPSFGTSHVETSTSSNPSSPEVICASATPYSVSLTSSTDHQIDKFDSFKNAIHTIIRSGHEGSNSSGFFLAADSDRYINMYDIGQKRLSRTLVVNGGVDALSVSTLGDEEDRSPSPLLAVTTEAGIVELFFDPFQQPPRQAELDSIKSKRKGLTRKASASIKLIRPDREEVIVPVFQALVQGPDVVIASTDGGVDVSFQKVRWQDEGTGELLFDGTREVFRSKSASSLNTATMNGVKDVGNVHVDESKVVAIGADAQGTSQDAVIEISSGEDEDTGDAEEESAADAKGEDDDDSSQEDTDMADPDDALRGGQEQIRDKAEPELEDASTEPTFGERLAAKNPDTISIADALVPSASSTLVATGPEKSLSIPSGVSLSTVLTQSLRTNDQNLLESCFHTTDLNTIRLTIQRLDSSLAGVLIQKLAERLSSRPGRYGHLLVWVQWTCIAHGGAIAGRPEIASKIKTLYKVLNERSQSLDNLLLLKGKLDMLDAQLTLRRQLQADRGPSRDPDDEDDVIYIEGQEEDFSSDEDETAETAVTVAKSRPPKKALPDLIEKEAESEGDEDMPLTNGIQHSDDDEDDADSDEEAAEEGGGLVDDEAVESNEDSHPSDQEEESEEEDGDTDEVDSEMDSFINDGSIEVDSESDIDVDDTPEKPPFKKTKRT